MGPFRAIRSPRYFPHSIGILAIRWISISFNRLTGARYSQTGKRDCLSMSTQPFEPKVMPSGNLVQIGSSVEDVIQQRLAEERERLENRKPAWSSARSTTLSGPRSGPSPENSARTRRCFSAAYLETRKAGAWRARRTRLPGRSRADAERKGVPDRQGVRQQRPV